MTLSWLRAPSAEGSRQAYDEPHASSSWGIVIQRGAKAGLALPRFVLDVAKGVWQAWALTVSKDRRGERGAFAAWSD